MKVCEKCHETDKDAMKCPLIWCWHLQEFGKCEVCGCTKLLSSCPHYGFDKANEEAVRASGY